LGWSETKHASQIANDLLRLNASVIELIDLVPDGLKVLRSGLLCVIAGRLVTAGWRGQLLHENLLSRRCATTTQRRIYEQRTSVLSRKL
jgi:hypothetical protein